MNLRISSSVILIVSALMSGCAAINEMRSDFYLDRANNCLTHLDTECAFQELEQAIELNPLNSDAFLIRGVLFMETAQYENAKNDFSRYLSSFPDDYAVLQKRGEVNYLIGDFDSAISDLKEVILVNPFNQDAHLFLGYSYYETEEWESAIEEYSQILELEPNNEDALIGRGRVYFELGMLDKSLIDLDNAIQISPNNPDAYYHRGRTYILQINSPYILQINSQRAIEDFIRVTQLASDYSKAYYQLAGIYGILLGDFDQSFTYLDKFLSLEPEHAGAFFMIAGMYDAMGEKEKAIANYEKALSLGLDSRSKRVAEISLENLKDK